jgi:hypothetical protein
MSMKNKVLQLCSSQCLRVVFFAAVAVIAMEVGGCTSCNKNDATPTTIIEAYLDTQATQVGGATTAVTYYRDSANTEWTLYSMANRFAATPIGATKGAVTEIKNLPGAIQHITLVPGQPLALLSMGEKGIGVVDITNPATMVYMGYMTVDYTSPSIEFVDGGGTYASEPSAFHTSGSVNDLLVYNDGVEDQLLIANGNFGIQKTKLSNLLGVTLGGAITIDGAQTWTLKYAGENPWGGPLSMKMHNGRLYAALGFLGIGIYDPATLARQAAYNLYADATTREDWFGYQHEKAVDLLSGVYIDGDGMPTWQQAQYELDNKNSSLPHYPWARFDRYGKYYYNALTLDVVDLPGGTTMAYIAYALGGLIAVDVTSTPTYAGYVPAPPAHGPDEPTGAQGQSILSHAGAGKLEESGVADVRVVPDANGTGYKAYFSDHFAGLVVVSGAENPADRWHGPSGKGAYNNDTKPQPYWPDYEFVTSYDMTPVPVGEESMPAFLVPDANGNFTAPLLLATGEINGHGGALFVMPCMETGTCPDDQVDLVQSSGAGGVSFIDIKDITSGNVAVVDRFAVPVHLASTNEVGAAPPGLPTDVAIGHTEGVTTLGNYLYLADGPHGMSVWRIADAAGAPTDELHLVANTLMDEYPVDTYLPAPHATQVAFGNDPSKAYVMSQSLGMRRVNVSTVAAAQVGSPALLNLATTDIYEHSTEANGNLGGITGQDHAYGATFYGNYALVADGGNGLTVYDITVPANSVTGTHVVANLGGTVSGKPPLGRATSVKLWSNAATGRIYAVVAAGPYGISVVDMTGLLVNGLKPGMTLLKTFEPIKLEEDRVGSADGKSVDVQIVNDYAYISYDSFGIVAYRMSDLTLPLDDYQPPGQPAGVCIGVSPTEVFNKTSGVDCRPVAVSHYKLQADPLHPEFALVDGGAQYMTAQLFPVNALIRNEAGEVYMLETPRILFYVAYAQGGVIKLDWSDVAKPLLLQRQDTVGKAVATAIANGRVYVADYAGGLVVFKK